MFFGKKTLDAEGFDFSTKEGRTKAKARFEEMLKDGSPTERRAAKILSGMFDIMDHVPDQFALVHEVNIECTNMAAKCLQRSEQLYDVAKLFHEGPPVHQLGMVDAYLTVANGSLLAAANLLEKLEGKVASRAAEKEAEDGPSGREAPTEYPPPDPVPPVEHVAPVGPTA